MNLRPPLSLLAILTAAAGLMVSPHQARASVTLSFEQVGPDVVATYSGSWDSWTETLVLENVSYLFVQSRNFYSVGGGEVGLWRPANVVKDSETLWTNESTNADSFSGDAFGFELYDLMLGGSLYAPPNYTAGENIAGSMTFNSTDIVALGFTPGDSGSFSSPGGTINYTVGAIPEPSSYGFLLGAVGLATAVFCRRRRARTD